jgi:outer membrane lipopolysaccharide assembly protein LptE/RlpB
LVYGPDGELRRERIRMAVQFSFSTNTTKVFELFTERDRQLNSKQHLGDNAEKILIEQEMQADILNQLLRFLAAGSV